MILSGSGWVPVGLLVFKTSWRGARRRAVGSTPMRSRQPLPTQVVPDVSMGRPLRVRYGSLESSMRNRMVRGAARRIGPGWR